MPNSSESRCGTTGAGEERPWENLKQTDFKKRVGLLGGAFDPPHHGHLKLAQLAWGHLKLDELRFVPSHINPQKQTSATPSGARLAMLREMLVGTPFSVDNVELALGGISYTVDTLDALNKREPGAAWVLIMGSDQANNFTNWRNYERILEMASVSIATRPEPPSQGASGSQSICPPALPDILSSRLSGEWSGAPGETIILPGTEIAAASCQIRDSLAGGIAPAGLSEQVLSVILHEKLYR